MSAFVGSQTVKRLLVRFKQKDIGFITDNWSVFRTRNLDVSAVGRTKNKFISALLERIKVISVMNCCILYKV